MVSVVLLQNVELLPTVGSGFKNGPAQACGEVGLGSDVISEKYTGVLVGVIVAVGVWVGVGVLVGVTVLVAVGVLVLVGVGVTPAAQRSV